MPPEEYQEQGNISRVCLPYWLDQQHALQPELVD